MKRNSYKKIIVSLCVTTFLFTSVVFADDNSTNQPKKQTFWSKLKKTNNTPKVKKSKKVKITEIELPPVQGKPKIPFSKIQVMTIDDCVKYALEHNPYLKVSLERVEAARAGIGQARSNYAPRFSVGYNLYHKNNKATQIVRASDNSMGFNVGVSDTIWDFGRTTATLKPSASSRHGA